MHYKITKMLSLCARNDDQRGRNYKSLDLISKGINGTRASMYSFSIRRKHNKQYHVPKK